jgi:hypothetical protein
MDQCCGFFTFLKREKDEMTLVTVSTSKKLKHASKYNEIMMSHELQDFA